MKDLNLDFEKSPYQLNKEEKDVVFTKQMKVLTKYHREHCPEYDAMLTALDYDASKVEHYKDIPFLPVGLFKELQLHSLSDSEDYKLVTSSGTSGQATSHIVLDGKTRLLQQQALSAIGSDFLGDSRLPMLVIDCPSVLKSAQRFSARAAGIMGFSLFGRRRTFALNDDMTLNVDAIRDFIELNPGKKFLIFGFTYIIWLHFCQALEAMDWTPDLSGGILVHGGGWKKLKDQAVSEDVFHGYLQDKYGVTSCHDYYGMAEQTGSIFMECECGALHCSDYSAVLMRRPDDFSLCNVGEKGIIQVMSVLPHSYPGHSLLTEDEGVILGVDDCPCVRKGVRFKVFGRMEHAEVRGCSDTYEKP